jgi:hypothetical protein
VFDAAWLSEEEPPCGAIADYRRWELHHFPTGSFVSPRLGVDGDGIPMLGQALPGPPKAPTPPPWSRKAPVIPPRCVVGRVSFLMKDGPIGRPLPAVLSPPLCTSMWPFPWSRGRMPTVMDCLLRLLWCHRVVSC